MELTWWRIGALGIAFVCSSISLWMFIEALRERRREREIAEEEYNRLQKQFDEKYTKEYIEQEKVRAVNRFMSDLKKMETDMFELKGRWYNPKKDNKNS